jgi:hypothetical protein
MAVEPVSDIKIGLRIWKYLGIAKETWEQIVGTPEKVVQLERRVAELESRLQRAPGEACLHCGALAMRLDRTQKPMIWTHKYGALEYHWKCGECGFAVVKTEIPKNMPSK